MNRIVSAALDVAVVLIFVAVGRSAHDEPLWGIVVTAAPFLVALGVGQALVLLTPPSDGLRAGSVIWLVTWIGGLLLRQFVFSDGTAPAFIVVAGVSLALGLIGWRVVAALLQRGKTDKEKPRDADSVPG